MCFGLNKELYNKIHDIVLKYEYEFLLFGSRARGDFKPNSDIDIAVKGNVSNEDMYAIRNDFDLINMPYTVDVVFVNEITKQELIDNIERDGVILK